MILFKDIEIRFGDFVAIHKLDLEINEGEFFTFLGPSGCGKTTTLRALVGFIRPSRGDIFVKGENIVDKPIEKRGIGMVFQSYALFPTMTVRENISFGLKENKWSKEAIDTRIAEVATLVNLNEEQLKKNVSELSGGQQQRVAIARALALKPDIIALDEPLSNLDAKLRKSLRVELKKIQNLSGSTMIYVTHDQEEALTLSNRIAIFNNGCIEQVGTPREIYDKPKSEFVTNFIGDSNRLTTECVALLAAQKPELGLSPDKHVYVRVENVKENCPPDTESEHLRLEGRFEMEEFYGITARRTYLVDGGEIRSVNTQSAALPEFGEKRPLFIHTDDLIVFAGE